MNEAIKQRLVSQLNSALAEASYWKSEAKDIGRWNEKYRNRVSGLRKALREISTSAPTDSMDLVRNMAKEALKSDQTIATEVRH